MKTTSISIPITNFRKYILTLASLFENEFSIDWFHELSNAKATQLLLAFDEYCQEGILKKLGVGLYCFIDENRRNQLRKLIPADERRILNKQIADLLLNEIPDKNKAINAAAEHLIYSKNDLEGCYLLCKAGDQYRLAGNSSKAKTFYEKAISDLMNIPGKDSDQLFIKIIISASKNNLFFTNPKTMINSLYKALKRAEKLNDKLLQVTVLLHLSLHEYLAGNYTSGRDVYLKGISIAQEINDPSIKQTLITSSIIHNCITGNYREAVRTYEYHDPIYSKQSPTKRLSPWVVFRLATACIVMGNLSQGFGMLDRIITDAQEANNRIEEAYAMLFRGGVMAHINDFENAISDLENSLKLRQKSDLFIECYASYGLAFCFYREGNFDKSLRYLRVFLGLRDRYAYYEPEIILEICRAIEKGVYPDVPDLSFNEEVHKALQSGNMHWQGVALMYTAIQQEETNDNHEKILQNLNESAVLLDKSGAKLALAATKMELGRYYLRQGQDAEAKKHLIDAAQEFHCYDRISIPEDLRPLLNDHSFKNNATEEILKLGTDVAILSDTKEMVQHILTTINRITGAERGGIFLKAKHDSLSTLDLWAGKNLSVGDLSSPKFVQKQEMVLKTIETGEASIFDEIIPDYKTPQDDRAANSSICVPMKLRGETIGALYHDHRLFPGIFKETDIKILTFFAYLVVILIDNVHSHEEIKNLNQKFLDEKQYLEEQQAEILHYDGFIADSPITKRVLSSVGQVAQTESTVLILGETGVGKEMVARAIHQNSLRREKPFIKVNCGALPEGLVTSELFGHEKGAFTGAVERRIGRFEQSNGGTLFLDEIGELSSDVQVRLLRVLQTKEFERLGGIQTIQSDFRLIAATNRNLDEDVASGRFRADLFYRLNIFPIYVPPLRERIEDIEALAVHFLRIYSDKMKKSFKGIPNSEMSKLKTYNWPGNIRELKNIIERSVILNSGGRFHVLDVLNDAKNKPVDGQSTLEEMERRFILQTLHDTHWKISGSGGAANVLGLNHNTLYSRMKRLGIKKPSSTP